jgi:U3 small nucleolar ribonucleoprotein protein IMP4
MIFHDHDESIEINIDDEYYNNNQEPNLLITSSRDPSPRLKQFVKELKLVLPNCQNINRGSYVNQDLSNLCKSNNISDLLIIHETRGKPDNLILSHYPFGPTIKFTLNNVVLRHDIPELGDQTVSQVLPHLIFNNFNTTLGKRVQTILQNLFPKPKEDSKRIITFNNEDDFINFRHHMYKKNGKEIDLMEIGPRFEMRRKFFQFTYTCYIYINLIYLYSI